MSRPPCSSISAIDRRTLIGGVGGNALASQIGLLGACQASAQGDTLDAAVAALATLAPLRPEDFGATGRAADDQTRAFAALLGQARRRELAMLRAERPSIAGERRLFAGLRGLLPGDVAGEFPAGGISAIRIVDPTRALPLAARAHWKLTLEGSFRRAPG